MLRAFRIDKTLKRNGNFLLYFCAMSFDIRAPLSCTMSSSVLWVSTSLDGCLGCVPIHNSAYGLSGCTSNAFDVVAAQYLAAADWVPTLPASHSELGDGALH